MAKIGIFSAKGGVGKTTFSINFSASLLEFNKNPLLIDTDLNNSLAVSLGLLNFNLDLSKVLNGEISIKDSIYLTPFGLRIIPAGNSIINYKNINILNDIQDFDFLVIDTEPGISEKNLEIAKICDDIFLITLADTTSVYATLRNIESFEKENIKISGLIINRYNKKSIPPSEIYDLIGIPVLAVLPEDLKITESLNRGIPYVFYNPYSNFSLEVKNFVSRFLGIPYKKPSFLFLRKWLGII
ncbi:MAG: P-loop NTPase [Candidatus Aenigmatarchaeota archaeon]